MSAMKPIAKLPTAIVKVDKDKATKKELSHIQIMFGSIVVAERTIPGNWNEAHSLTEFRRFSTRFKVVNEEAFKEALNLLNLTSK